MRVVLMLMLVLPLLAGCETVKKGFRDITGSSEPEPPRKAEPMRTGEASLAAGIKHYEEGNYAQAQRLLQASLAEGLPSRASQARAHKYLAFIYCVTDRTPQCRQEFNHALAADPKFTLSAAEAGHPTWGPVFRSVSKGR